VEVLVARADLHESDEAAVRAVRVLLHVDRELVKGGELLRHLVRVRVRVRVGVRVRVWVWV
tara:strand:- start:344 stop:526 length:183 start_codon:yes stop_codon:yes gene_type:complete